MTLEDRDQAELSRFRFSSFAFLLALAAYIHQLSFGLTEVVKIFGYLHFIALLLLLFKPSSLQRFVFYLAASWAMLLGIFQFLANHLVFEFLVTTNILIIIFAAYFRYLASLDTAKVYSMFAPIVRSQVVLLYFFAFFAKLNSDFFTPEVSCAVQFGKSIIHYFHLDAYPWISSEMDTPLAQFTWIWLTVVIEGLLPLLLLFRRTRDLGVLVGVGFHGVMGIIPTLGVSSFSNLGFAMLFLFMSDDALLVFKKSIDRIIALSKQHIRHLLVFQIAVTILIFATIWIRFEVFYPNIGFLMAIWLVISVTVTVLFYVSIIRGLRVSSKAKRSPHDSFLDFFLPRPRYFALLLIPLLVNGLTPYIAIKTQTSFTMFSNLRVLGSQPNHLIIPNSWRLIEHELIEIKASDHPNFSSYADLPLLITEMEFRKKVKDIKEDFSVTCLYLGNEITIGRFDGILSNHPLLTPPSWLQNKFLRFKDVSTKEHCDCSW